MPHVVDEIASQPDCWAKAGQAAHQAAGLPGAGERVAVVGCGTSFNIACAYAARRERTGQGETDAFTASEMPPARSYDRVLFLTRSGTTTEVVDAIGRLPTSVLTTAITADINTPIVALADEVIALEFADERSIVQTRFATSALVLLRSHLGDPVGKLIDEAHDALAEPLPESFLERTQFTFLGQAWTVGLAHEAALKLREAARVWAESYPAMEYRHGPISVSDERSLIWSFGAPPIGLENDLAQTGATFVTSDVDPLVDLIRAQRLAVALAEQQGLDPDNPRYLTRSVILANARAT